MAQSAHAMARPAAPQPPPQSSGIPGHGGTAAPPSLAALGADLIDKSQNLSTKQVRNLSKFPIVAVDLYANDPHVALYPPKSEDPSEVLSPVVVGKMKAHVLLKKSEAAQKTLRKYLTKTRGYTALVNDTLGPDGVAIEHPHKWLGVRRVDDTPEFIQESFTICNDSSSHAIAEESATSVGVTVANGTLDGTSAPSGDDFDRVVYKVRLCESKKALAVLPEEAVTLILATARTHASRKVPKVNPDDEEEALEYPVAVPLPGWACNDACVEALLDATGGSGVVVQRSMAALAGALLPGEENHPNNTLERVNQVRTVKYKEHQREHPEGSPFEYDSLFVLVGLTADGIECTAVQISELQPKCPTCLFGNFKVLANISYLNADPSSQVKDVVKKMYALLEKIAPEADGPVGFITYGTSTDEQKKVVSRINLVKSSLDSWEKVPTFMTRPDCVAVGAAVLGGVSHGRVRTITTGANGKPKAQLAIRVQNVAPTAVGVRMNYYGGVKNKWTPVKVIFDFDRRVPAGPYPIDLKASECAAIRNAQQDLSDEDLLKAAKDFEGKNGIPEREKAALDFRLQVVQQYERDGAWIKVGDAMSPLTKLEGDDDHKVACENVALELSLGATGLLTSSLVGDRESVAQATVSARNSKLRYYIGILAAILFFGGFMVKSYVEERVFERDTKRLLAYYKHVVPGSIMDGDEHNARYLVWKYRGKKNKLWKRLETKYGEPVLEIHEYPEAEEVNEDEEDVENLDESTEDGEKRAESETEPDL